MQEINWLIVLMELLGGMAFFLFGMEKMSDGLKKTAGNNMRKILSKLTGNRFLALTVGAFVTMIVQSSSATSVMMISFVQSGLMSFTNSMGVMLGANIGTTFTAQLVAFKLTDYALLFVFAGFITWAIPKAQKWKNIGDTLLGFGVLFYGMKLMSMAMTPLRSYPPFIELLQQLENPLAAVVVASLFTALIQSSSAFTGIVIVLAQQGLVSLEVGIPLVIGSNIGTCFTAWLAALGAANEAKRVALAHVFFNLLGAIFFLFFIPQLAWVINQITAAFGGDLPRQIANAHTVFNLGVALLFVPLLGQLDALISKILPLQTQSVDPVGVRYLDTSLLTTPDLALGVARAELSRVMKSAHHMYNTALLPFAGKAREDDPHYPQLTVLQAWDFRENKIDFLAKELSAYLVQINKQKLNDKQSKESLALLAMVNHAEQIGDIIQENILPAYQNAKEKPVKLSDKEQKLLNKYHQKIAKQFYRMRESLSNLDAELATKVLQKGEKYQRNYTKFFETVLQGQPDFAFETSNKLQEALRQIEFNLERMADAMLYGAVHLKQNQQNAEN